MYRIYRNGQIEYYHKKKTNDKFWDEHWMSNAKEDELKAENQFILDTICKYNNQGDRILEAGCGSGFFLYPMHYCGFKAIGVDFAKKTLYSVKRRVPQLKLCVGNLEKLPFRDKSFDGYWSIGVIEHFKYGYAQILNECYRILKIGGIAYISFPYMNLLRKLKGKIRMYNGWDHELESLQFYQYALDYNRVKRIWESQGFEFLDKHYMFSHKYLNFGNNKLIKSITDPWHHHSILLIFRKTTTNPG